MDNPTRKFVLEKLSSILGLSSDNDLCTDLEKCIVRHSEKRMTSRGLEAAWDNHRFTNIYKHKYMSIQTALKNNDVSEKEILRSPYFRTGDN